jgi:tRNA(Ile)-lysidine synthase
MSETLGLQLHTKILDPRHYVSNLEEACRQERLRFFAELCAQDGYRAVLLAQHADDQSETVLKRVLEGAALFNMGSMRVVSVFKGICLWRPLLKITKQQIADWLAAHNLVGFDDCTNSDQRFLRGKLRVTILPELSRVFGKEVCSNLLNLGFEAAELHDYLESKITPFLVQAQSGTFGVWLDCNQIQDPLLLEIKFLVRKCCELEKVSLSRANIRAAAEFLIAKQANKSLSAGENTVIIDRGHLFVLSKVQEPLPRHRLLLKPGLYQFGSWSVRVTEDERHGNQVAPTSWRHLWNSMAKVILPAGQYYLSVPESQSSLSKMWANEKVPVFLRNRVPAVYSENILVHEFLSGRQARRLSGKDESCLNIELWKSY